MSATVDQATGEKVYTADFEWEAGVHEAAELFPMMSDEAFNFLVADIATNGQRDDIWLSEDGRLLDGRNRLAACQALELEPKTRTYVGSDPAHFVVSLNVHRRHLTASQLATVAVEALPSLEAEAKARMLAGKAQDPEADLPQGRAPQSAEVAGGALGVSATLVKQAKAIKEADPEAYALIRIGTKTVTDAYRELRAEAPTPPADPGPAEEPGEDQQPEEEPEAEEAEEPSTPAAAPSLVSLLDDYRKSDDQAMQRMLHKKIMTALVGFGEPRNYDPVRVAASLPERDNQRVFDLLDGVQTWLSDYRTALAGADVIPMRSVK